MRLNQKINQLLEELRTNPYKEIEVKAPCSGKVKLIQTKTGEVVLGPRGKYKQKPGTLLAYLTRENNQKKICAPQKGRLSFVASLKENEFVQAGALLFKIKNHLSKQEVIKLILKEALSLFRAPEKGKYYFLPAVDKKIKAKGCQSVKVVPGEEIVILNRMKRETYVAYQGPAGVIYVVYFQPGQIVEAGDVLFGVCPERELEAIKEVVLKVQSEWEENGLG